MQAQKFLSENYANNRVLDTPWVCEQRKHTPPQTRKNQKSLSWFHLDSVIE